jgi:glucans biosynthesis protein C
MRFGDSQMASLAAGRSSLAINNLRAVVIVLVLLFHAVLAYLNFLPQQPFAFDAPPYLWRAFPIVDSERWLGFDVFCAWLDVYLMSFFFLLSGLFVWSSLSRKGPRAFLQDRVLRLGLPFAIVVTLLMPVALYPTYLQSAAEPGIADYWRQWLALPLWPSGPVWFLWLLMVWGVAAAGLYVLFDGRRDRVQRLSFYARQRPAIFLAGLVLASALAYIPLALVFGPSDWFQRGPFAFQLSRPLHYALYFFAGAVLGACGIERGLLASDGPLARRWARWLVAAPLLFALWMGLTALAMSYGAAAPLALQAAAGLSFVLACFSSCFLVLALAVRFGHRRARLLDSLKDNAFGMYLVHYLFVVWLQYALLPLAMPALAKGTIVFGGTLLLSWSATAALRRIAAVAQIIGADRRPLVAAGAPRPLPSPVRRQSLAR